VIYKEVSMKRRHTAASFGLLFSAILASTVVLTTTALGRETKHITFDNPVMIGSVTLKEGDYAVKWEGMGPEVTVTFQKNGDTVATAPARLVMEKNRNRRSIETTTNSDSSRVLKKIAFNKEALVFDVPAASGESR
jgi:hypothetical protein